MLNGTLCGQRETRMSYWYVTSSLSDDRGAFEKYWQYSVFRNSIAYTYTYEHVTRIAVQSRYEQRSKQRSKWLQIMNKGLTASTEALDIGPLK